MSTKTALILSGGGAKGAFQCTAEKYAREVKGYHWDMIAGVSVGALNGVMLAMQKYDRLYQIWNAISNEQVYTGGFNVWSLIKILFGARSFYGNEPLRRLLAQEYEPHKICTDLRIGAVSLVSGEYTQFTPDAPHFLEAVLASTVIPIIWTPVEVSPQYQAMVDGGARNVSPLGDVLVHEPDEIVVINCDTKKLAVQPDAARNIIKISLRTSDILVNELFRGDLEEFLHINALVKQAEALGFTLYNPSNGMPYKYYECKVIEPEVPLDDPLDFSQPAVQRSLEAGWERAKAVLGT